MNGTASELSVIHMKYEHFNYSTAINALIRREIISILINILINNRSIISILTLHQQSVEISLPLSRREVFFDEPSTYPQQRHQQLQPSPPQQQLSPAVSPTCHIPSERSAFCPLLKKYMGHHHHHQVQMGSGSGVVEAL